MEINNSEVAPNIRFEYRAIENRSKSEASGHLCYDNVLFAYVTTAGGKHNTYECIAEEWIKAKEQLAMRGSYPQTWAKHFREAMEMFKKGEEIPPDGTPLSQWPQINPGQIAQSKGAGIFTVEQWRDINKEGMDAFGMGALHLKQTATAWLASADRGKVATQIANLQAELVRRDEQLEAASKRIDALEAMINTMKEPAKRGRPPNEARAA